MLFVFLFHSFPHTGVCVNAQSWSGRVRPLRGSDADWSWLIITTWNPVTHDMPMWRQHPVRRAKGWRISRGYRKLKELKPNNHVLCVYLCVCLCGFCVSVCVYPWMFVHMCMCVCLCGCGLYLIIMSTQGWRIGSVWQTLALTHSLALFCCTTVPSVGDTQNTLFNMLCGHIIKWFNLFNISTTKPETWNSTMALCNGMMMIIDDPDDDYSCYIMICMLCYLWMTCYASSFIYNQLLW